MLEVPDHLVPLQTAHGVESMWASYVPRRLLGSKLKNRKQLWFVSPQSWEAYDSQKTEYFKVHEESVNRLAKSGGIGVLVYDLSRIEFPDNWLTTTLPFAKLHQRLHLNGSYDKWLVKTYVIVPNEIVYTALNAVLAGAWKPTRPLEILSSIAELQDHLRCLWLPR